MPLDTPIPATPFWKSKTLWLNTGVAVLTGVLQMLGKLPSGTAMPAYILTGANFLLRFLTNSAISTK